MSDYVKDLNIVDFLGIIVPGSILVLLLAGDNADLLLLWTSYFGADASPLVRGIFLAIAGYLAGMILHEIGDLAEKGVWCFTRFDPKAYAINAVGMAKINAAANSDAVKNAGNTANNAGNTANNAGDTADPNTSATNTKQDNKVVADERCVFPPFIRGILGCILTVTILGSCTLGFSYAMQAAAENAAASISTTEVPHETNPLDNSETTPSATNVTTPPSTNETTPPVPNETPPPGEPVKIGSCSYLVSAFALFTLLAVVLIIAQKLFRKYSPKQANNSGKENYLIKFMKKLVLESGMYVFQGKQGDWETLQQLCLRNPQLQTYLAQNGAMPKKMSMFDSFRHLMRNLLIAVAIVNVFSIWHPIDLYRDIAAHFVNAGNITKDFGTLTFWFCFVILFAFSRYSHFVFLRYKYSYEALISNVPPKTDSDVAQHHIVLECKNQIQKNP